MRLAADGREIARRFKAIRVDSLGTDSSLGGMRMMDSLLWRLWPLDEIERLNKDPSEYGVQFSDFLIDSHVYRLKQVDHDVAEAASR